MEFTVWIFNPVVILVIREENNYLQREFLPGGKSAAILGVNSVCILSKSPATQSLRNY